MILKPFLIKITDCRVSIDLIFLFETYINLEEQTQGLNYNSENFLKYREPLLRLFLAYIISPYISIISFYWRDLARKSSKEELFMMNWVIKGMI